MDIPVRLDDVRRDWTRLGAEDPLWAVLVGPGKRGGNWSVEEFLSTGRADVEATRRWLDELGMPTRWERVLDFGCGVGRLSQALAQNANEVVGVDISVPMLDKARELDRSGGVCQFVVNESSDLRQFPDGHFDLVYTTLVLQHLPRPVIDRYVAEFLRVLRPGGIAVMGVATCPRWTPRGIIWRFAPFRVIAWAQRRLLGYPAPMRMTAVPGAHLAALVAANGGEVVGWMPDRYPTDWRCTRYVVRGDGAGIGGPHRHGEAHGAAERAGPADEPGASGDLR
jgi:SAM-dependent methyltransferase